MNTKMKRRLVLVSVVVVVLLALGLVLAGGATTAKSVTVSQAVEPNMVGQKIQVSGTVVQDSFSTSDGVLTFKIYDPAEGPSAQLEVSYAGVASATFGNGVVVVCTGKIDGSGVLVCSELVTKCPSKYESAEGAPVSEG